VHFPDLPLANQTIDSAQVEKIQSKPVDYSLAVKNKGRPPKSWRWEIYAAGKSKPVRQSEFFGTMSEAVRTGKAALAEIRTNGTA
jgi:hypothetical protein